MKIEIWSDICCPFCYIGKRKFEKALSQFEHRDKVEVEWYSFELDQGMKTESGKNIYDYLAERKGRSREWSEKMHEQVTAIAKEAGLNYNFDVAVVSGSFDAHRLIQYAKTKGKGDAAEESLFKAYFTDGMDISDLASLIKLAPEIGLDAMELSLILKSEIFTEEVREDEKRAARIGVNGVPFFVLDNKYAISGAQDPETFLEALRSSFAETVLTE